MSFSPVPQQTRTLSLRSKFQALNSSDHLSFVELPDVTNPKGYEEAVKGVIHVIHLASSTLRARSSVPNTNPEKTLTASKKGRCSLTNRSAALSAPTLPAEYAGIMESKGPGTSGSRDSDIILSELGGIEMLAKTEEAMTSFFFF